MNKNIHKNITMDEIAEVANTSIANLKKVFKKYTGNGTIHHFNMLKLEYAKELLKMENEQMQTQYKVLSKRVDAALEVLNDLQQRDDNMYRVILQAEPVNDEIRNNGIYNPSRYENLLQMSDAELVVSTSQKVDNLARQVYVQCNS